MKELKLESLNPIFPFVFVCEGHLCPGIRPRLRNRADGGSDHELGQHRWPPCALGAPQLVANVRASEVCGTSLHQAQVSPDEGGWSSYMF